LLHTTGQNYYAGSISMNYADGSSYIDHMGPGKITNWWYPSDSQDRKQMPTMRVAWRGKNKFSRNVGVCLYGLNNPFPGKEIVSLHFQSAGDQNKWMVLGVTLSDYEVFFMPDFISTGIPDNWGAAAIVYALVEGLCGIVDEGTAFSSVSITPRWKAAGEDDAWVTIKYPASGGYVRYHYQQSDQEIRLIFTGTMNKTRLQILLPSSARPDSVLVNDKTAGFDLMQQEGSTYLVLSAVDSAINKVIIKC
jgi:hypothetical protein